MPFIYPDPTPSVRTFYDLYNLYDIVLLQDKAVQVNNITYCVERFTTHLYDWCEGYSTFLFENDGAIFYPVNSDNEYCTFTIPASDKSERIIVTWLGIGKRDLPTEKWDSIANIEMRESLSIIPYPKDVVSLISDWYTIQAVPIDEPFLVGNQKRQNCELRQKRDVRYENNPIPQAEFRVINEIIPFDDLPIDFRFKQDRAINLYKNYAIFKTKNVDQTITLKSAYPTTEDEYNNPIFGFANVAWHSVVFTKSDDVVIDINPIFLWENIPSPVAKTDTTIMLDTTLGLKPVPLTYGSAIYYAKQEIEPFKTLNTNRIDSRKGTIDIALLLAQDFLPYMILAQVVSVIVDRILGVDIYEDRFIIFTPAEFLEPYNIRLPNEDVFPLILYNNLDEPMANQDLMIQEIHACLGASEFAYYEENGQPKAYFMSIARKLDWFAKAYGVAFNPDGTIIETRQRKTVAYDKSNKVKIPDGWTRGQFADNEGGTNIGQTGGQTGEERMGIAYQNRCNQYDNFDDTDPKNNTMKRGDVVLCENFLQLFESYLEDMDKGLNWQEMGTGVMPSADGSSFFCTYEGMGTLIAEVAYMLSQLSSNIYQTHNLSAMNYAVNKEIMKAIGVPIVAKVLSLELGEPTDIGSSVTGSMFVPAIADNAPNITQQLGILLSNIALVLSNYVELPEKEVQTP